MGPLNETISRTMFLTRCWSFVGRQSDRVDGQELSLGPLCWEKATVSHEVMHSLGFFHEHSRYDRDKYIDINLDNVELSTVYRKKDYCLRLIFTFF